MKQGLRTVAENLVPPTLLRSLRRNRFHYSDKYRSWEEARAQSTGYDDPSILEKVAAAALKVKRGEAAYERDSVLFDRIEYSWPVLGGLLWAAARNHGRLTVLDFGGSLGTVYFQNRKFLDGMQTRWCVVEQPAYVAVGKERFEDERLGFYDSIDAAVSDARPDVALLGSALQYIEAPYALLERLTDVSRDLLILDRTPFLDLQEDRIAVEHVPPSIFAASYPFHMLSLPKFERWVRARGWTIVETFESLEGSRRTDSGTVFTYKGMLLRR